MSDIDKALVEIACAMADRRYGELRNKASTLGDYALDHAVESAGDIEWISKWEARCVAFRTIHAMLITAQEELDE